MLKTILKKWWMILLQGILLIFLGVYLMNNPGVLLVGLSFWIGLLTIGTGIAGVIEYFSSEKDDRDISAIIWGLLTAILGILMLTNLVVTMKMVTVLFGLWMLATGALIGRYGWDLKGDHSFGWILLVIGILSVIAGLMMVFNMGAAAIGISTLLGLQTIMTGLGFILLAIIKRVVVSKVKDKVASLQSGLS